MRERAAEDELAPGSQGPGIWKAGARAFFRTGGFGEWRARLSTADPAAWAHGGQLASGVDPEG